MSFITEGRSTLRTVAVGGALLGAFAFASPANAALGGATPSNFTTSPNLVSVTANAAEETVVYKFDRTISAGTGGLDAADFVLGGYDAAQVAPAPSSVSIVGAGDSVLADFGGTDVDFNGLTYAAVNAGTVKGTVTNSKDNFDDATRITGATTESGTTGHTDGPDLVAAALREDLNQIVYVFDQKVDDSLPFAGANFEYTDVAGATHTSLGGLATDNLIVTQYGPADDVSDATRATIDSGANITAEGYTGAGPTGAFRDAVDIAGKPSPATPNLVSASIDTNGGSVTYVFDKTITVSGGPFHVFLANGDVVNGGATQLLADAKSVRVTFGLETRNEFAVFAAIGDGAVTGATNAIPSQTDGAPIGGNAGAQASGYTTAPDAIQALVNPAAGQASVLFDSRFSGPADATAFDLYTADGVALGNPSAASATVAAAPQQSRVVLTLTDTQAANAKNVVIDGGNPLAFGGTSAVVGTISGGASANNVVSSLPLQATTGTFRRK